MSTTATERPAARAAGLSTAEAERGLAEVGPNAIAEAKGPSPARQLAANFVQPLALLLWACAGLALLGEMPELSAAIALVVVVNALFSFFETYRAERAVAALRQMLPQRVRVRRDGAAADIASEDVVPGDVLLLAPGDRVAADADLSTATDLRVDESALTGESRPLAPERQVFAGTYVTGGAAEAVVTATGMQTRFGRIAALSQRTERVRSPLEHEIDRVVYIVAALAVTIGSVFFLVSGLTHSMDVQDRFVFAIGVTVALVPNGLLPTVTLSLAMASQRMAKRNGLVRRLSAVETLGETTVICTDKTGTLTENQMTVQRVWTPEREYSVEGAGYEPFGRFRSDGEVVDSSPLTELLRAGLLCNDAQLVNSAEGWSVVGDPTEGALVVLAEKGGLHHRGEAARAPRVREIPFSSERKRMTTVHLVGDERVAYAKGAAELILPRTTLSPQAQAEAAAAEAAMERDALRVLACARRVLPDGAGDPDAIERDLEFLGLVGMIDPPRPEVPDAVERCRGAGIRLIMVTGDSGRTAEAIARRIGMIDGGAHVVTGTDLAAIDDGELRRRLGERDVIFARIDPEQKLRLARLLREDGEIVAMTGDGVNDAPALKHADMGVAMGSGTDVAKEAADLVLLDDNFTSIVAAVEEGRAVYDNMRRFIGYHFSSNVGEFVPFLVWGISGGAVPLPLVVMQVIAIDLGTDQVPAMGLGSESPEPGTMARPPRPRSEHLLDRPTFGRIAGIGSLEGVAAMASFFFAYVVAGWRPWEALADSGGLYREATTMTMAGIVFAQVGAVMAWRTTRESVRSVGLLANRLILAGIGVEIAMVALLAYVPGIDDIFHTGGLSGWEWLFLLVWPPVVLGAEELRKAAVRRRRT